MFLAFCATSTLTHKSYWKIKNVDRQYFFKTLFESRTISGNIVHSISNYLLQFVILEEFVIPLSPHQLNVHKCIFNNFNNNKLINFNKIYWNNEIYKDAPNTNDIFNAIGAALEGLPYVMNKALVSFCTLVLRRSKYSFKQSPTQNFCCDIPYNGNCPASFLVLNI